MSPQRQNVLDRVHAYYHLIDDVNCISPQNGNLVTDTEAIAAIGEIYASNAVYERERWPSFFKGRDAIVKFLENQRTLVGQHQVKEFEITKGILSDVKDRIKLHFPTLNCNHCQTVRVKGRFRGEQCALDGRFTRFVSTNCIDFVDYWVVNGDAVIYRYSQISPIHELKSPDSTHERY